MKRHLSLILVTLLCAFALMIGCEPEPDPVAVSGMTLTETEIAISSGETVKLDAVLEPADATVGRKMTWTTSSAEVAEVDQDGNVTGKGKGQAVITARTEGGFEAECRVSVDWIPATALRFREAALNVEKNTEKKIEVVFTPKTATVGTELTWKTSDPETVSVTDGTVKGLKVGSAVITAETAAGLKASCTVNVSYTVPVKGIALDKDTLTLIKGKTAKLTAAIDPENTTEDKTITWTSGAPDIVEVDENGNLTAKKPGEAVITASLKSGHKDTCTVTVTSPLKGISLDKGTLELRKDGTFDLTVIFDPEDTTDDRTVIWTSSAPGVASVENGKVTGLSSGKAVITASVGERKAECEVYVDYKEVASITIKESLRLPVGGSETLTVSMTPSDATIGTAMKWSSTVPAVAEVDGNGKITAKKAGDTVIVAESANGKKSSCTLTVFTPSTALVMSSTSLDLVNIGDTAVLTVKGTPEGSVIVGDTVWSSENPGVAEVDGNGKVTAVSKGTAVIKAVAGELEASCTVRVNYIEVTGISFEGGSISIGLDEPKKLSVTYAPETANEKTALTWKSGDTAIAEVDAEGNVTGKKAGKTTVTATTENGKIASINVFVDWHELDHITLPASIRLALNGTAKLAPEFHPAAATIGKKLTWSVDDDKIASVDQNGNVKGLKKGIATVTATPEKGTGASVKVYVDWIEVTGIAFENDTITVPRGTVKTLAPVFSPSDANVGTALTWTSSIPGVATVGNTTGEFEALAAGKTVITVTTENGKSAMLNVTVNVPLESISLGTGPLTLTKNGEKAVSPVFTPSDADTGTELTWESDNENVAKYENGKIKARGAGTTVIRVSSANGKTAEMTVSVEVPAESVSLDSETLSIPTTGGNAVLTATVLPPDANRDTALTWTSSNTDVATVSDGTVTPVAKGETVITVSTANGRTDSCTVTVYIPATGIKLSRSDFDLPNIGDTAVLTVSPSNEGATIIDDIIWSSSDKETVSVENGTVTALKKGSAVITATAGKLTASCTVTVNYIEPTAIAFENTSISLEADGTATPSVKFTPEGANEKTALTWKSDAPAVAEVDRTTGLITGKATGKAVITATTENGKNASITVFVDWHELDSVSLPESISIGTGGEGTVLTPTYNPADATVGKEISWTVDHDTIATVDQNGKVIGVSKGVAVVTATPAKGTAASTTVYVDWRPLEALAFDPAAITVARGSEKDLEVKLTPADANVNADITWTSGTPAVATVDETTGKLSALKAGTTLITASASDGKIKAELTVNVNVPVAGISIGTEPVTMKRGTSLDLTAVIDPADADTGTKLTWTSSKPGVASVGKTGTVNALTAGETVITVTTGNNKSADLTVKVNVPLEGISLPEGPLAIEKGGSLDIAAVLDPVDADTGTALTWESDDETVAKYDNGRIHALSAGSAVIKVTSENSRTASVTVNIEVPAASVALDRETLELADGESVKLAATVLPADANKGTALTWESSNTAVATVKDGTVTAEGKGEATVTVKTANGKSDSVKVSVYIPAEAMKLSSETLDLPHIGDTAVLSALPVTEGTEIRDIIEWSSDNEGVAKVTDGTVEAVGKGTAVIKATAGTLSATCTVTVNHIEPVSIAFGETSISLKAGGKATPVVNFTPADANEKKALSWSSDATEFASVDVSTGEITGNKTGKAVITATTENGKSASVTVFVDWNELDSVSLPESISIGIGGEGTVLTPTFNPADATVGTDITWTVDDDTIATVDKDGKVTGVSKGIAVVTAAPASVTAASTTVYVDWREVESVMLDRDTVTIARDGTVKLSASFLPEDANVSTGLTWTVSGNAASVDQEGSVMGASAGTSVVTVTTENGKTASCTVNVNVPLASLAMDPASLSLEAGTGGKLSLVMTPADADTDTAVTWTSSREDVASVDQNGNVTAASPGTAVITARTAGNIEASAEVTVVITATGFSIDDTNLFLDKGRTVKPVVKYVPENATAGTEIQWTTADAGVAAVGSDGTITPVGYGKTTLKAVLANGNEITLNAEVYDVYIDQERPLAASLEALGLNGAESLVIGGTIADTDYEALRNMPNLAELDMSGLSNTSIPNDALRDMPDLKKVKFPEGITHIGERAFRASGLTEVTIPGTVATMGLDVFADTKSLVKAVIEPGALRTLTRGAFWRSSVNEVVLPPTLDVIDQKVFRYSGLQKITLPEGLEIIGYRTFEDCGNLVLDTLPESLRRIESCAFRNCGKMTTGMLPAGIEYVGDYAFENCSGITDVCVPKPKEGYGHDIFKGCTGIINAELAEGMTDVPRAMFMNTNIRNLTLPSTLEAVRYYAFHGATLGNLTIPEGVKLLENETFQNSTFTGTLTLPSMLETIGYHAFANATVGSLVIPPSVKTIEKQAFMNSHIPSITLNEGLETLGYGAFAGSAITEITIPSTVKNWLRDENEKAKEPQTFRYCPELTSVTVSEGITALPEYCFADCPKLKTVDLPSSIDVIRAGTFFRSGLEDITLPEGLQRIENIAFDDIPMTAITLPASLTELSDGALDENIRKVTFLGMLPPARIQNRNAEGNPVAPPQRTHWADVEVYVHLYAIEDFAESTWFHPVTEYGDQQGCSWRYYNLIASEAAVEDAFRGLRLSRFGGPDIVFGADGLPVTDIPCDMKVIISSFDDVEFRINVKNEDGSLRSIAVVGFYLRSESTHGNQQVSCHVEIFSPGAFYSSSTEDFECFIGSDTPLWLRGESFAGDNGRMLTFDSDGYIVTSTAGTEQFMSHLDETGNRVNYSVQVPGNEVRLVEIRRDEQDPDIIHVGYTTMVGTIDLKKVESVLPKELRGTSWVNPMRLNDEISFDAFGNPVLDVPTGTWTWKEETPGKVYTAKTEAADPHAPGKINVTTLKLSYEPPVLRAYRNTQAVAQGGPAYEVLDPVLNEYYNKANTAPEWTRNLSLTNGASGHNSFRIAFGSDGMPLMEGALATISALKTCPPETPDECIFVIGMFDEMMEDMSMGSMMFILKRTPGTEGAADGFTVTMLDPHSGDPVPEFTDVSMTVLPFGESVATVTWSGIARHPLTVYKDSGPFRLNIPEDLPQYEGKVIFVSDGVDTYRAGDPIDIIGDTTLTCTYADVTPGLVINAAGDTIEGYTGNASEVIVPDGIISIGTVFRNNADIRSISLPSSLDSLDDSAFRDSGLSVLDLPVTLFNIGAYAFSGTDLTSATLHGNVQFVGDNAFADCPSLTSITVENNEAGCSTWGTNWHGGKPVTYSE